MEVTLTITWSQYYDRTILRSMMLNLLIITQGINVDINITDRMINTVTNTKGIAVHISGNALDGSKIRGNNGTGNKINSISLDGTLKTMAAQPFGQLLLTVTALGLLAYGLYSWAEARYRQL